MTTPIAPQPWRPPSKWAAALRVLSDGSVVTVPLPPDDAAAMKDGIACSPAFSAGAVAAAAASVTDVAAATAPAVGGGGGGGALGASESRFSADNASRIGTDDAPIVLLDDAPSGVLDARAAAGGCAAAADEDGALALARMRASSLLRRSDMGGIFDAPVAAAAVIPGGGSVGVFRDISSGASASYTVKRYDRSAATLAAPGDGYPFGPPVAVTTGWNGGRGSPVPGEAGPAPVPAMVPTLSSLVAGFGGSAPAASAQPLWTPRGG